MKLTEKSNQKNAIYISNFEEFLMLARECRRISLQSTASIYIFSIQEWTREQNDSISKKVNQLKNICGCATGNIAILITLIFLLVNYVLLGYSFAELQWTHFLKGFLYILCGAIVGKLLGLFVAKIRLLKLIDEITIQWNYKTEMNLNIINH